MTNLHEIADNAMMIMGGHSILDIRDWLDIFTGGELETVELDILSDMVERRLKKQGGA